VPFEALNNEKELLSRVAQGDRNAFERIYPHYFPLVQQYIRLFVKSAENLDVLTQDVFLKVWEKRVYLATVGSFRSYLFQICKHHVFNYLRALKLERRFSELGASEDLESGEDSESQFLLKQYYDLAMEAIDRLPDGRRKILKMSFEQNLTLDEIAARLGITKAGVKKQLYAARNFVRTYLLDRGEISVLLFVFVTLFER
jgi:RNA polymerase sigma-70 factor (family 1)